MPSHPLPESALLPALLGTDLLTPESAEQAEILCAEAGLHPITALLRLNAISEDQLFRFLSSTFNLPIITAGEFDPADLATQTREAADQAGLNTNWFVSKGLLALKDQGHWRVGFRDRLSADVMALLNRKLAQGTALGHGVNPHWQWVLCPPSVADRVHKALQPSNDVEALADDVRALRELAEEGPTIEFVNTLFSAAVTKRASDLHFEPGEFGFSVRMRIDGHMVESGQYPKERFDAAVCRIKILASLDIAERRLPQDGRINAKVHGEAFDIRVSIIPGVMGESVVLRLLRQERKPARLEDLGMASSHASVFSRWTHLANGIVLVTGPTGSGKSTTLYTALELANDRSRKIITVEDPVEYRLEGITQLQVNADIGFTFASALRSILRHDPDLILVGEIRDRETAQIAVQAALTGHLVLSTLHTNSAVGAITRLVDMELEPFLVAASVRGLMAQRLVRRLCTACAAPCTAEEAELQPWLQRLSLSSEPTCYRPVGCEQCNGTGYYGRLALYDLVEVGPELAHLIATQAPESELQRLTGYAGSDGLLISGMQQVAQGKTTVAEVLQAAAGS